MKLPFAYYGGKTTLAARIAAMLPAHGHYVEPFAGSLAVLLAKAPARHETVNDADRLLMTFWRVLRDRPAELYSGWYRYELPTGTGQAGRWGIRTEVLRANRPLTVTASGADLFSPAPFHHTEAPDGAGGDETRCPACGGVLHQPATGRPRRYCSPACCTRGYRSARTDHTRLSSHPEEAA